MPSVNKKFLIGFVVALLLAASFTFRKQISGLLVFGSKPVESPPVVFVAEEDTKTEDVSPSPTLQYESPSRKAPPLYTGRDPAEIRPVPEEVKLFTETQKQQLYSTIKTHAAAVKRDATYFNGWIQVGILKKTIGDFEGARDAWEYAGLIEPFNSLSFANLGELYWRYLRDFPKAEENLKISIKHKPDDFQTWLTLADLYHYSMKEKADQASKVLLDGISANENNLPVKVNLAKGLARLYVRQNELAKAVEWWQKVLAMEPGNVEVAATIEALKKKINP